MATGAARDHKTEPMTVVLNPPANAAPLLTYGLQLQPDPLQASSRAALNLVVSNATGDKITCYSIQLTLPVGNDATDLIDGSATIATQPPAGWSAHAVSGVVTFTPPRGSAVIEGGGLVFTIATTANAQPGSATVALQETASDGGAPQQRSGNFSVNKFPIDFSLSDLQSVPSDQLDVSYGHPAVLSWIALGQGVSCTLQYTPGDDGVPVSQPVPNIPDGGKFETKPLTRSGVVVFTLTAQVSVLGQDQPFIAQRQHTATIVALSLEVAADPPAVGINGLVRLTWSAPNADHCTLEDGRPLPPSGTRYFLLTSTRRFTVHAFGQDGQMKQQQRTVRVLPDIVPTEAGHAVTGDTGPQGSYGYMVFGRNHMGNNPVPPGPGGRGSDSNLSIALPPLDLTDQPARVIPITVTGGRGGDGGPAFSIYGPGDGGPGGDAHLTLTWEPNPDAPAQFIVKVSGGSGGGGGSTGASGSASATIDGQVLALP